MLKSPLLRFFSSAVIDQAVLSAANLIIGLLLFRHSSDVEYGHFVLANVAIMLLISVQGAYVDGPLLVLAPRKPEQEQYDMLGAVVVDHRRFAFWLSLAAFVAVLGAWALHLIDPAMAFLAGAFVLAAYTSLRRDLLRYASLLLTRPQLMLLADGLFVLFQMGGSAFAAFGPFPAAACALLALALANVIGQQPISRSIAKSPGWSRAEVPGLWKEMSSLGIWATIGVVIYWTSSQGSNYIIAARLDVAAVAGVAASSLLLKPINLLTTGVKGLLTPMAARWNHDEGLPKMMRRLALFATGLGGVSVLYCIALWFCRDWVRAIVLKKPIADFDGLLVLWMLIYLLGMVRDMFQAGLLVRKQFRPLAALALISTGTSLVVIWFGLGRFGVRGAMMGQVVGEGTNLAGVLLMSWWEFRADRRGRRLEAAAPA